MLSKNRRLANWVGIFVTLLVFVSIGLLLWVGAPTLMEFKEPRLVSILLVLAWLGLLWYSVSTETEEIERWTGLSALAGLFWGAIISVWLIQKLGGNFTVAEADTCVEMTAIVSGIVCLFFFAGGGHPPLYLLWRVLVTAFLGVGVMTELVHGLGVAAISLAGGVPAMLVISVLATVQNFRDFLTDDEE